MSDKAKNTLSRISPRERDVMKLLAEGYSHVQIATMLNISASTVSSHRRSIQSKLHVDNITGIIRYALKFKLIA